MPQFGKVKLDYPLEAANLGLKICPENAQRISSVGMSVLHVVNEQVEIKHPILSYIKTVDLVEIYGSAKNPGT